MNHFEQAGLVFYTERNYLMSINLFLKGIEIDDNNSMLWYGLGESFYQTGILNGKNEIAALAIGAMKRSLEIDPANQYSAKLLDHLKGALEEENFNKIPVATYTSLQKMNVDLPADRTLENFNKLSSDENKIRAIMHLGETKDPAYYELLKHCILNEEDQQFRFAALKRIPYYSGKNLKEIFAAIAERNKVIEYEPYFSMALSQIDEDWANELINPELAPKKTRAEDPAGDTLSRSLQDQELVATIALGLIRYDRNEILKLFSERNGNILSGYLINGMNDQGISMLILKQIFSTRGEITDIGWAHIKKFIDSGIERNTGNHQKSTETPESAGKKWWQFWK